MATPSKLKICVLGIGLLMVLYIAYPAKENKLLSEYNFEYQEFLKFSENFNKKYSTEDHNQRFQIYNDNIKAIRVFNTYTKDFILAANKFADMTPSEFSEKYSREIKAKPAKNYEPLLRLKANPQVQDWRDEGAVSDVIDQGDCNADWAIAVVGSIEGAIVAKSLLSLVDLSVQEILDCISTGQDHGCGGGIPDDAFEFVISSGLTTDTIYPFTGVNQTCNTQLVAQNVTTIKTYLPVISANNPLSLITAVADQPVVAGVDVSGYVWQFYYTGVINQFCGTDINHYALIVGYNLTAIPPYYIVKNSWGQDWGESGYVRIGIYGGVGICGIQQLCSYPVVN